MQIEVSYSFMMSRCGFVSNVGDNKQISQTPSQVFVDEKLNRLG